MAGNTINMYGGSYVDVHDNEVVNLNIEKAEVKMEDDTLPRLLGTPSDFAPLRSQAVSPLEPGREGEQRAEVLTENAEFMAIMEKAMEAGFCTHDGWQYRWKVKVEAAYFASVASHRFNLSNRNDHDGDKAISWIPFEALFAEKGLRLTYNDIKQCKTTLKHKVEIDKLFR